MSSSPPFIPFILLSLAACGGPSERGVVPSPTRPSLQLEPCRIEEFDGRLECGTLKVFEDREAALGRMIGIHFSVLRAASTNPLPDPIFYFAGGPGLAAGESIWTPAEQDLYLEKLSDAHLGNRLTRAWDGRGHVYVDARGTGRSGSLDCMRGPRPGEDWSLREIFETPPFNPPAMARCLEELRTRVDLTKYTTSLAADDIDDVREALGYESINVHGSSYGSRLGLEYVRRHGDRVRTATLVGVAPAFGSLVTTMPSDVAEVMEKVLSGCEMDVRCHEAFPKLRQELAEVLQAAASGEVRVTLENPVTGETETVEFRHDRIVSAIRYMLYGVALHTQLPLVIHLASEGDFLPLAQQNLQSAASIDVLFYEGFFASVKCSEELAFVDHERAARIAAGTMMGRARLDAETEICREWPKAAVPADFHQPVRSEVPLLLINGDRDPATPARLARKAIETLPNGLYVELSNRSHILLADDVCDLEIQIDFLQAGSVEGLDISCASRIEHPPFVTRLENLDPHFLTFFELEDAPPGEAGGDVLRLPN